MEFFQLDIHMEKMNLIPYLKPYIKLFIIINENNHNLKIKAK